MKEEERIRCPVHDLISFKSQRSEDVVLWNLLQTPAVQRLRRIKQLGFSEFVYPGATHTRLSHVLGAMQMARRMLDVLQRNNAFGEVADFDRQRSATLYQDVSVRLFPQNDKRRPASCPRHAR